MSLRKAGNRTQERMRQICGLGLKEMVGVVPGISGGGASDGRGFLGAESGMRWLQGAPASCAEGLAWKPPKLEIPNTHFQG